MMTNAEHQKRWRQNHKQEANRQRQERFKKRPRTIHNNTTKRFIALDGEGAGIDQLGRQNYLLLRAGDAAGHFHRSLSAKGARLRTDECLDFILDLPRDAILVGFFFGYDVTQILRDLPRDRIEHLFAEKEPGKDRYTWWREYGIEYIPRQYFRVCRIDRDSLKTINNSSRTINEVGGFFQKSFVEAIRDWGIGDKATVDMIARNKDRRETFETIGAEEDRYCQAECKLLAQLMTKFRETCIAQNIVPLNWRGAGHISARLHQMHDTPKRKDRKRPAILDRIASEAYYGGRFEVTTIGRVRGDVWEYDINSAYPAAMLSLPCPVHGRWKKFRGSEIPVETNLYLADMSFKFPDRLFLCGFPIREKARLYFPRMGSGIYWSPEIKANKRIGAEVTTFGGYYYVKKCDCNFFGWVEELYEARKRLGKGTIGYPIKLGINGLYGKFAQRLGGAPWQDYIMAGLITAFTRAKLIDAYAQAPDDILYIATDAIYSRSRLELDIGSGLGQWEETKRDGIFIVQPGIYWSSGTSSKPKTRGIPRSVIIENWDRFEQFWDTWLAQGAIGEPPIVPVFVNQFIGLRAALARGKPELSGTWLSDLRRMAGDDGGGRIAVEKAGIRQIDFDWKSKRRPYGDYIRGECMVTQPLDGRPTLRSQPYNPSMLTDFQGQERDREGDPDFYPWGNSGE